MTVWMGINALRGWWLAWASLTWLSVMLCCAGCLLPYWIRGTMQHSRGTITSDIGLFRRCTYPIYTPDGQVILVGQCGRYDFIQIPNLYWQVSLLSLAIACGVSLVLTFVVFFLGFCVHIMLVQIVHRTLQVSQLFAGLLTITACFMYPLGWQENTEVTQICGQHAAAFRLGNCEIGWAFVLASVGGFFTLLSSFIPTAMTYHYRHFYSFSGMEMSQQDGLNQLSQLPSQFDLSDANSSETKTDNIPPVLHRMRTTPNLRLNGSLTPQNVSVMFSQFENHRYSSPIFYVSPSPSYCTTHKNGNGNRNSMETQVTHLLLSQYKPPASGALNVVTNTTQSQQGQQTQSNQSICSPHLLLQTSYDSAYSGYPLYQWNPTTSESHECTTPQSKSMLLACRLTPHEYANTNINSADNNNSEKQET